MLSTLKGIPCVTYIKFCSDFPKRSIEENCLLSHINYSDSSIDVFPVLQFRISVGPTRSCTEFVHKTRWNIQTYFYIKDGQRRWMLSIFQGPLGIRESSGSRVGNFSSATVYVKYWWIVYLLSHKFIWSIVAVS